MSIERIIIIILLLILCWYALTNITHLQEAYELLRDHNWN